MTSRFSFYSASLIYALVLAYTYVNFTYEKFAYQGFEGDLSLSRLALTTFVLISAVIASPRMLCRPTDIFVVIFLYVSVIPTGIFYIYNDAHVGYLICHILAFHFLAKVSHLRLSTPRIKNSRIIFYFLAGLIILIYAANFFLSYKSIKFNLDLNLIYDFRADNKDQINSGLLAYVNNWVYFCVGPLLIAIALRAGQKAFVFGLTSLFVVFFAVTQDTMVLFTPFAIIALHVFINKFGSVAILPLGLAGLIIASFLIFVYLESLYPATWFPRRVLFVPAQIGYSYFSFFESNPFVLWSNSFITAGIVHYPYDEKTAIMVGEYMGLFSHANASFIGSGYMHAGYFGVFIYTIMVGMIFVLINSFCVSRLDVIPLFLSIFTIFFSSDLITVILTKGLLLGLLLVYLYKGTNRALAT